MKNSERIASHFSSRARVYKGGKLPWIWNFCKVRESEAFTKLLSGCIINSALDIGCGQGHYTHLIASHNPQQLYAIDSASEMGNVSALPSSAHFIKQDLKYFRPHISFDVISMMGCWEFLEAPFESLELILSWLTPGGQVILSIPKTNLLAGLYRIYYASKGISLSIHSKTSFAAWCNQRSLDFEILSAGPISYVMRVKK